MKGYASPPEQLKGPLPRLVVFHDDQEFLAGSGIVTRSEVAQPVTAHVQAIDDGQ